MAELRRIQVTFDCADPWPLAGFWCAALGYVLPPGPEGFADWEAYEATLPADERGTWAACQDPTGAGPRLYFQRVPETKTVKNRVHVDVRAGLGLVGDERLAVLQSEGDRLEGLGASRVRLMLADEENESCLVMQDPEGNEFCLD